MNRRIRMLAGAAALAGVIALASGTGAQVQKGKSRPLTTKQLMAALVKPEHTHLSEGLKDAGPADEKGWDTLAVKAALLNESAHIMMADGRCPDATWAGACKQLEDGSAAVLAKIEAKDAAGAREAMGVVTASCKSCHTAHKK
jgi:cytochrome c556